MTLTRVQNVFPCDYILEFAKNLNSYLYNIIEKKILDFQVSFCFFVFV